MEWAHVSFDHMIRPDALPTDPAAALTEMVLALDVENEELRVAMRTLKEMLFGKRSERLAALVAEQLALELDDLETGATPPVSANDDAPAAKPSDRLRKKARRNIGALPKHLLRCEQVLEPEATACSGCQGQLHKIGEDVSEVPDVIPAMERVSAPDRERHGLDRARDSRGGLEVRLVFAAVPAGGDPGRPGRPS
ncbi:zinc-finger binding domain of transposase IS66 [Bradyrhizobium sp. Rc3b]|nr:zinc-finger binding domain of transposase IS66 [Bradyrhizobium sp. Rc3b]